jgi:chloramphenicol O-acetyltransferase type A
VQGAGATKYNASMGHYLDLANWKRKELYNFFIDYANPYFNVCARVDITTLVAFVRSRSDLRISVALHYVGLRIANEIEPFRYRLKEKEIFVYDAVHGGTTVLMPNETFTYAYFDYQRDFDKFVADMTKAVDEVRAGSGSLKPTMRDDVIYHTSLPWMSFTSFAHARNKGRGESIPRIVYGKFTEENSRLMIPISVEVHHALMDGIDVGRFFNRFEEAAHEMETFVT